MTPSAASQSPIWREIAMLDEVRLLAAGLIGSDVL